ncbi:MAG: uncharacterized protein QG602_1978 [Verrucomicrobiota bacterium]|nr:uncharacterized protein [Verrucomicrobiota bacterium]
MHARFAPKAHRFVYRIFLFALDLDELDALHRKLRLFSLNRRNLYSFREQDYLPTHEPVFNGRAGPLGPPSSEPARAAVAPYLSLKQRVVDYLGTRGIDLTGGRVLLVSLPRVFGYLFNPVSFYFCYDRSGAPVAALAEVTNTFKEMKPYLLGPETNSGGAFHLRVPKHFYVSPFSDVDVAFDFQLRTPGNRLSIQIDDYVGAARTLTSTLTGPRQPLNDARLAWFTLKYPLITLKVIGLIHWHALRLWWKNVPWFAKSSRATDQRDLYRPHGALRAQTTDHKTTDNRPARAQPFPDSSAKAQFQSVVP